MRLVSTYYHYCHWSSENVRNVKKTSTAYVWCSGACEPSISAKSQNELKCQKSQREKNAECARTVSRCIIINAEGSCRVQKYTIESRTHRAAIIKQMHLHKNPTEKDCFLKVLFVTKQSRARIEMDRDRDRSSHSGSGPGPIPNRWLHCPRTSESFIADRFLAFKTPLNSRFAPQMAIEHRFQPDMVFSLMKMYKVSSVRWDANAMRGKLAHFKFLSDRKNLDSGST